MNSVAITSPGAGTLPGGRPELPNDIVEVSLLLSRQQVAELVSQAQRCGLTSAQFLRQCISTMCSSSPER
jgi:hypothetical protein